jgi:hypothetical protein
MKSRAGCPDRRKKDMESDNKTINKAHQLIKDRIEKLRVKRQDLKTWVDEKYPVDLYGCKGETLWGEHVRKIDDELKLLRAYDSAFYDLFEVLEHKDRMEELRKELEDHGTNEM